MADVLGEWLRDLCTELGVGTATIDRALIDTLLAVARDAAHGVARPAAPLTTFAVGYAAGLAGGGAGAVAAAAERAQALAVARGGESAST